MANEIYHRSNWGNAVNDIAWGDTYEKFDATNEMFVRSDNYENSNETDKLMAAINPKPSILLTPTAYDNGSLHSVKPVLSPFASFDFTRGSSATRVNEKGLIEDVQILSGELVQNGDFEQIGSELVTNGDFDTDSDWIKSSGVTISNGSAHIISDGAYQRLTQSGILTVGKKYKIQYEIVENNGGQLKMSSFSGAILGIQSTVGVYTIYGEALQTYLTIERLGSCDIKIDNVSVKEVGQNWSFGTGWSMGDNKAVYDGVATPLLQSDYSMTASKKYRTTIQVVDTSGSGNCRFAIKEDNNTAIGFTTYAEGTITLEFTSPTTGLFGIQASSSEGSFDITNISVIEITDDTNLPRIDYTDGTGSLLLEPQSTNLITYSENFSQWGTVNGVVVTDNFATSPDGTQNAAKVVYDGTSLGRIEISTGASGTNTQSIYLKTVSGTQAVSIGSSSSDLTEVTVTSEWQRFTHTGSGSYPRVLCNDATTIFVWGAMLEQKSFATSYIPTSGSTVTRNAEVCNNSGSAQDFSEEGVLYVEYKIVNQVNSFPQIQITDSSSQNQVSFYTYANILQYYVKSNNINVVLGSISVSENTDYKFAISYSSAETSIFLNGVKQDSYLNKDMPSNLEKLNIITSDNVSKYKSVAVFKEALTDAELTALTT